ncbi:MAG: hypothetical protein U9R54_06280 [Bacteroidota bacterium]|nr:hypothetical protein [Bacteroidota bacterium]
MFVRKIFILLFVFFIHISSYAQISSQAKELKPDFFANINDSLKKAYGNNKIIPKEYELSILAALANYPELIEVKIEFKYKAIKTTMAARPVPSFIVKKNNKRKYIILINNKNKNHNTVLLSKVPFNARVGVIAHELGHIVDYESKNKLGILKTGIGYLFKQSKKCLESKIDIIAINHGLGWQLFDYSYFILYKSKASEEYKKYKKENYFHPQEVLFIQQLGCI